jgi:metallo-beta-lactamase class B
MLFQSKLTNNIALAILLSSPSFTYAQKYKLPFNQQVWSRDYQPFRIAGNLYYVGTADLACYLVTTPKGHVLINTGLEESVPLIKKHITSLGFKFSDIKILLATHAHYDHVAGMASIKKETGAKMMIHAQDAKALADGGASDYVLGEFGTTFEPVKADRILKDQEVVRLEDTALTVLHHPGHTPGANSFLLTVKDDKRSYKVLIANFPGILDETKLSGMPGYPDVAKDYGYTIDAMKKQEFDLWVASHAGQFGLEKKRKEGDSYNPEAFADQKGYDDLMAWLEKRYREKLKEK